MLKQELRKTYKALRLNLTPRQVNVLDDLLLIQFQQLPLEIPSRIMTYAPMEKFREFNPQAVTDYCYFKNPDQQLMYPLMDEINGEQGIIPILVNDDTVFAPNAFGVDEPVGGIDLEPAAIDLVIVPLLCFDARGYRVGYGKGYYDRFLKKCRPGCLKIGFSYFAPVPEITDAGPHDVKLDYCVTHDQVYAFSGWTG